MITGATGYIGGALLDRLIEEGNTVHALVRNVGNAASLPAEAKIFEGDLFDNNALQRSMEGVEEVYHIAAYARPWAKSASVYTQLNVDAAENVFRLAAKNGVRRVVFTSTAGVFGPSLNGDPVFEDMERRAPVHTDYERSKMKAEDMIRKLVQEEGHDIVVVNPSRVYGPGKQTDSNGVTKMIKLYLSGKFRFFPGDGNSLANYVFVDDVVNGHLLAMANGIAGERYALGGENASYKAFFERLSSVSGVSRQMFPMPQGILRTGAYFMKYRAEWLGIPPLLTPEWVDRFMEHWALSTEKAQQQLGYNHVSLEKGLKRTIDWLQQQT